MKSYVVVGLGRFGTQTAKRLCELGCEVLAIDQSNDLVQHISEKVTQAVVADARDKDVLRALGVADFDCAIVAIGGSLGAQRVNEAVADLNESEGTGRSLCGLQGSRRDPPPGVD